MEIGRWMQLNKFLGSECIRSSTPTLLFWFCELPIVCDGKVQQLYFVSVCSDPAKVLVESAWLEFLMENTETAILLGENVSKCERCLEVLANYFEFSVFLG